MKMYMVYSEGAGPSEGAVLAFADSASQAKSLAFKGTYINELCEDYTDVRAHIIKDRDWLESEKRKDVPHVIETPKCCDQCLMWGGSSPVGDDGLCDDCREDLDEDN
jgi:hypothetical protein